MCSSDLNPWSKQYETAEFSIDGKRVTYPLSYQSIALLDWERTHFGSLLDWFLEEPKLSVREFAKNKYWLSLPYFSPASNSKKELKRDFESFFEQLDQIRKPRLIVIDLRNNMGGYSTWAEQTLEHLFGKSYVDRKLDAYRKSAYENWRVSEDNRDSLIQAKKLDKLPGYEEALKNSEPYFKQQ